MGNFSSCDLSCCRRYEDQYVLVPDNLRRILQKRGYDSYLSEDIDNDNDDDYNNRYYGLL